MSYSTQWVRFLQAEEAFFTCRQEVVQDETALGHDLQQALASIEGRETALRLLAETTLALAVVQPLLADLVATALDSSNLTAIGLARQVLARYKAEAQIRSTIPQLASRYLAENDEWHYRRLAELYGGLNYEEELTDLLMLCQAHPNAEIREIRANYLPTQE
ncbi:hypothetical protein [Hymenobacter cellulosivorans]|uniref:HEAT repeat domain-containing protein n=1 Tax=Hymenobacter cellulosivorans TaxID=2932249 RepID=A0ABY4F6G2_9BACT|nr:hypothetical protein [Hymenobacter cellulosivorans]UOQ51602.1 hypothetical protein MUN80_17785 [Hymenobacter cellulosivorans]